MIKHLFITCLVALSAQSPAQTITATSISASDGAYNDHIAITWAGPSGKYYALYRSADKAGDGQQLLQGYTLNQFSYNDYSAVPERTYYYQVRAGNINGAGAGPLSAADSGYLFSPGVTASQNNTAQIFISYKKARNTYVEVLRSTTNNPSTATSISGWIKDSAFAESTSQYQPRYYWVREALDAAGTAITAYSAPAATGFVILFPAYNVAASQGSSQDYVQVSWNGTFNTFAMVYRNTVDNFATATPLFTNWMFGVNYQDNTAAPGVNYYYYVVQGTNNGTFKSTPARSAAMGYRKPGAPVALTASQGTYPNKIHLVCTPLSINPGVYYQFYQSTSNNVSTATAVGAWQTATTLDYPATDHYTHYFWARSCTFSSGVNPSDYCYFAAGYSK